MKELMSELKQNELYKIYGGKKKKVIQGMKMVISY